MSSPRDIEAQIAELERKKQEQQETIELFLPQFEFLKQRKAMLEDELAGVRANVTQHSEAIDKLKDAIQSFDGDLVLLRRELARRQAEENAQRALIEREASFLADTADFPWRSQIHKYQLDGAVRMAAVERGLLGDWRGLGKSLTGFAWADMVKAQRLLVLAPRKSAINLKNEISIWAPHRKLFYLVGSTKAQRDMVLQALVNARDLIPQFTVIVNLEAWRKDDELLLFLKQMMFDSVIIDESHKVKESDTSMFDGAKQIIYMRNQCPSCGKFSVPARVPHVEQYECKLCGHRVAKIDNFSADAFCSVKKVLLTTGSPIKNRPGEIWSQLYLIDRVSFPTMNAFKQDFLRYDANINQWVWKYGGEEKLVARLGMRYLARTPGDVGIERPPVSHQTIEVVMSKRDYFKQYNEYWKLQDEFLVTIGDEEIPVTTVIAQFNRLQQLALWPHSVKIMEKQWDAERQLMVSTGRELGRVEIHESAVMDAVSEQVRDLVEEGHRVVVFSKYREQFDELQKRLTADPFNTPIKVAILSASNAEEVMLDFDQRTFNKNPNYKAKWDVVLTTYAAGGESVNFTNATQVVKMDLAYSPEDNSQAEGRVDRTGQLNPVTIHTVEMIADKGETCYQWLTAINKRKESMLAGFETEVNLAEIIRQEARRNSR